MKKTLRINLRLALLSFVGFLSACSQSPVRTTDSIDPAGETLPVAKESKPSPAVESLRSQAIANYSRGEFPRAVQQLESSLLLEGEPSENWPQYLLYYCYLATGDYRNALRLSETLVQSDPFQSTSYQQVGLAQLSLGNAEEALLNFQRALEFETHATRTHFYVGLAQERLKNIPAKQAAFAEAEKEYAQTIAANPNDFSANFELASLYLYWNQSVEKVPLLVNAAKTSLAQTAEEDLPLERRIYAQYYLPILEGILLFRRGSGKEAVGKLVAALSNMPSGIKADLAEIYHYLGSSYALLEEMDLAKGFLERSLQTDPEGMYSQPNRVAIKTIERSEK